MCLVLVKGAELAALEIDVPLPSPSNPWCFLWCFSSWHHPCAGPRLSSPLTCFFLCWLGPPWLSMTSTPIPSLGAADLGQPGPGSAPGHYSSYSSLCRRESLCSHSKQQIHSPAQLCSHPGQEREESGRSLWVPLFSLPSFDS